MVKLKTMDAQLKNSGIHLPFWVHPEVHELTKILSAEETIHQAVSGRYTGGFALLCATNLRLLLIDKRLMSLTLEDVRYEMISEVDFRQRLVDATVSVATLTKTLHFTSLRKIELRQLMKAVQTMAMQQRQTVVDQTPQRAFYQALAPTAPLQNMASPEQLPQPIIQVSPVAMNKNPYTKMSLVTRERLIRLHTGI